MIGQRVKGLSMGKFLKSGCQLLSRQSLGRHGEGKKEAKKGKMALRKPYRIKATLKKCRWISASQKNKQGSHISKAALPTTQVCRGGFSRLGETIPDKMTLSSGE